jgi:hypothetical protein
MSCSLNTAGRLRKMLFRITEFTMRINPAAEPGKEYRVIPELLAAPVLGPALPENLAEFAALLRDPGEAARNVNSLSFGGPGRKSYGPNCEVEFLEPDGGWRE